MDDIFIYISVIGIGVVFVCLIVALVILYKQNQKYKKYPPGLDQAPKIEVHKPEITLVKRRQDVSFGLEGNKTIQRSMCYQIAETLLKEGLIKIEKTNKRNERCIIDYTLYCIHPKYYRK